MGGCSESLKNLGSFFHPESWKSGCRLYSSGIHQLTIKAAHCRRRPCPITHDIITCLVCILDPVLSRECAVDSGQPPVTRPFAASAPCPTCLWTLIRAYSDFSNLMCSLLHHILLLKACQSRNIKEGARLNTGSRILDDFPASKLMVDSYADYLIGGNKR